MELQNTRLSSSISLLLQAHQTPGVFLFRSGPSTESQTKDMARSGLNVPSSSVHSMRSPEMESRAQRQVMGSMCHTLLSSGFFQCHHDSFRFSDDDISIVHSIKSGVKSSVFV